MKMPAAVSRGGGGGIGDMFLRHGEKLGFFVIACLSAWLMWSGVSSLLTKRPTAEMAPSAIKSKADAAEQHVRQSSPLPEEMRSSGNISTLSGQLAAWSKPVVAPADDFALLDKPLFNAFEKRTKPDVFPVEDLHVEAGVAVLPKAGRGNRFGLGANTAAGSNQDDQGTDQGTGQGRAGGGGRGGNLRLGQGRPGAQRPSDEDDAPPGFGGLGGFGGPGRFGMPGYGGAGMQDMGTARAAARMPGTVVPYVLVTGLVPYGKQLTEYEVRYGQSSYRDPQRDTPKWSRFLVERAEDDGSGELDWQRIDTNQVAEKASTTWMGLQPELLPADCLLSFDVPELGRSQQPVSPFAYNMPLPRRVDSPWGVEAIHPWFQAFLEKRREEQRAMQAAMGGTSQGGSMGRMGAGMGYGGSMGGSMGAGMGYGGSMGGSMGAGMGYGGSMGGSMGAGMGYGASGPGMASGMRPGGLGRGMGGGAGGYGGGSIFTEDGDETADNMMMGGGQRFMEEPAPVEYRLFRFIDTDVEPGKTYRYRVRVSLWNPNIKLHPQHLASEDVATPSKLASEPSEASQPIRVPGQTLLLARTLDRTDARKVRGAVEALVLGPHPETGNLSLRSMGIERGGVANISEEDGSSRSRGAQGDPVTTDSMLVDFIGEQEKPDDRRRDSSDRVPEPLDLLFMSSDGSLEVVSAASTQETTSRYVSTLPSDEDEGRRNGQNPMQPGFGPGRNGSSPFGPGGSPFGPGGSPFGPSGSPYGSGGALGGGRDPG